MGRSTIFLIVIAGAVQATLDANDFKSFWDGVWWAVVTVTTVDYGDIYPRMVAGRADDFNLDAVRVVGLRDACVMLEAAHGAGSPEVGWEQSSAAAHEPW